MKIDEDELIGVPSWLYAPGIWVEYTTAGIGVLVGGCIVGVDDTSGVAVAGSGVAVTTR
jgi:hypothetical protein